MLRALIADDQPTTAELLSELLEATGEVSVVSLARDGAECLRLLEEHGPDVLFLDIRMPGMSGIEVAEAALDAEILPLLVFVTDYDDYAVKAFELDAVDYLVKPADLAELEERIGETVSRCIESLANNAADVDALRTSIERLAERQGRQALRRLPVKDYEEGTVRLLEPSAVSHIRRIEGHVTLFTRDKTFRTYHTIERLAERLAESGFFQANRGALVNVNHIEHLIPNGDGSYDAILRGAAGGACITVSRSRARELLDALGM